MADSYLDLRGGDRLELDLVARDLLRGSWEDELKRRVREELEEKDLGTKKKRAEIADAVVDALPRSFPAEDFVNELGRLGWEILPPEKVREVKRRLEVYRSLQQSRLPEALRKVKMRAPRVKRLRGEVR